MRLIKTYNWNRRDFYFDAICEHCKHTTKNNSGYDDDNYYNNVIPDMKCPKCNESSNSKQSDEPKTITLPKYDKNITI